MLTRLLRRAAVMAVAAAALVCTAQVPALAGGPGGPFGHVQCNQSTSAQCTVTAGSGPGTRAPGAASGSGAADGTAGAVSAMSGAAGGCSGTQDKAFGCVPAGCVVTGQTLACPIGTDAAAAGAALPAPVALAELAVKYLQLPDPVIGSSPAPGALQLARLPVWLWIAAGAWQPRSQTAAVPGESVTATAAPVSAAWSMGDGTTVTCTGPGTAYAAGDDPAASSPTCGHTYQRSSAGQPGGAYQVTVTITWDITWSGAGGAGGALAPVQTTAAAQFRVAESQGLNTSGG